MTDVTTPRPIVAFSLDWHPTNSSVGADSAAIGSEVAAFAEAETSDPRTRCTTGSCRWEGRSILGEARTVQAVSYHLPCPHSTHLYPSHAVVEYEGGTYLRSHNSIKLVAVDIGTQRDRDRRIRWWKRRTFVDRHDWVEAGRQVGVNEKLAVIGEAHPEVKQAQAVVAAVGEMIRLETRLTQPSRSPYWRCEKDEAVEAAETLRQYGYDGALEEVRQLHETHPGIRGYAAEQDLAIEWLTQRKATQPAHVDDGTAELLGW